MDLGGKSFRVVEEVNVRELLEGLVLAAAGADAIAIAEAVTPARVIERHEDAPHADESTEQIYGSRVCGFSLHNPNFEDVGKLRQESSPGDSDKGTARAWG